MATRQVLQTNHWHKYQLVDGNPPRQIQNISPGRKYWTIFFGRYALPWPPSFWFLTVMGRSWLFPRKPTVWHDVHFYLSKSQRTCTTRSLILTFDQARFLRPTLIKTSKDAKACLVHVPVLICKIWQNQTWKDLFIVFLYVFFVFHIFFLFNLSTFNLWSFSCH